MNQVYWKYSTKTPNFLLQLTFGVFYKREYNNTGVAQWFSFDTEVISLFLVNCRRIVHLDLRLRIRHDNGHLCANDIRWRSGRYKIWWGPLCRKRCFDQKYESATKSELFLYPTISWCLCALSVDYPSLNLSVAQDDHPSS